MGRAVRCVAEYGSHTSEGRAQLETDFVLFRGDFRVKLLFRDVRHVEAGRDWLELVSSQGTLRLQLGPIEAQRWARAIQNPKSIVDKLGVKPGMRLSVLGLTDDDFLRMLDKQQVDVSRRKRKNSNLVIIAIEDHGDLRRLDDLEAFIARDGSIWTVSPKGLKGFNENDIYEHMRGLGFKDVKTARFSETHTANKFVIPTDRR